MTVVLPLSRDQIRRGIGEYEGMIEYVGARRAKEPMAGLLQLPKLPNKLTECFVAELVADKTLFSHLRLSAIRAGRGADIVVDHAAGTSLVEVKGTAQSFTMFSQKDLDADYLVWVDFGVEFRIKRLVGVHAVERLGGFGIRRDTKMILPEFLRRTAGSVTSISYDWRTF